MQMIGDTPRDEADEKKEAIPLSGMTADDMMQLHAKLTALGFAAKLVPLNPFTMFGAPVHAGDRGLPYASLLIVYRGIDKILEPLGKSADDMYAEQIALPADKHVNIDGRVVEKRARWNLCFDHREQEPDYEAARGRIVPWSSVPCTDAVRRFLAGLHPKMENLVGEGNYYYNPRKCGIGPHGDSERQIVVGARLGVPFPLEFQWHHYGKPMYASMNFELSHGDLYISSDKAVGHDWLTSKEPTLRHWACGPAFLKK